MGSNPLRKMIDDWLPEIDFGVMQHGFAPHGRDYIFVLQAAGTYEVTLTHVVELNYETRVRDDVWPASWDDRVTDYAVWESEGHPGGYVWGTNWSLAYPGLSAPDSDPRATEWARRLGKPIYAVTIETDRFKMSIVFHDARSTRLSDDDSVIRRVLIPVSSGLQ